MNNKLVIGDSNAICFNPLRNIYKNFNILSYSELTIY